MTIPLELIESDLALLAQTVAAFESGFSQVSDEIGFPCGYTSPFVHDGRDWSRAPNGIQYLTVTSGGLKPEGATQMSRFFGTMEAACQAWLVYVRAFAFSMDEGMVLYWRRRPEIEMLRGKIGIYSRLAVGGAPKVEASAA